MPIAPFTTRKRPIAAQVIAGALRLWYAGDIYRRRTIILVRRWYKYTAGEYFWWCAGAKGPAKVGGAREATTDAWHMPPADHLPGAPARGSHLRRSKTMVRRRQFGLMRT
jgi:hypothetical protein